MYSYNRFVKVIYQYTRSFTLRRVLWMLNVSNNIRTMHPVQWTRYTYGALTFGASILVLCYSCALPHYTACIVLNCLLERFNIQNNDEIHQNTAQLNELSDWIAGWNTTKWQWVPSSLETTDDVHSARTPFLHTLHCPLPVQVQLQVHCRWDAGLCRAWRWWVQVVDVTHSEHGISDAVSLIHSPYGVFSTWITWLIEQRV